MNYVLSTWSNIHDNAVKKLGEGDWSFVTNTLLQYKETDNKYNNSLFNMVRFSALEKKTGEFVGPSFDDRRINANAVEITGLVIDFDNDSLLQRAWTIDEVAELYKAYNFLIYTSYSNKKVANIERFRLVMPLARPIAIDDDYPLYLPSIKEFFGYEAPLKLPEPMWYQNEEGVTIKHDKPAIDKASFVIAQGFFLPACPAGRAVEYRINQGKFLDPSVFKKTERTVAAAPIYDIPEGSTRGGDGVVIRETFDVLSWLQANGLYIKALSNGKHQIVCPHYHEHSHQEKSGTVLLPAKDNKPSNIYCHHNHEMSTWKLMKELGDDAIRPYCLTRPKVDVVGEYIADLRRKREPGEQPIVKPEDILIFDERINIRPEPVFPYDRAKRLELIKRRCMKKAHDKMLLCAFEGFGKSHYAVLRAQLGQKVLFASTSNEQALEQAESFKKAGLRVQTIIGREFTLENVHRVPVAKYGKAHPWDNERVNEKATKRWMLENIKGITEAEVQEIWDSSGPEEPDFANHDIICTTIARVMSYGTRQAQKAYTRVKQKEDRKTGEMKRIVEHLLKEENQIVPDNTHVFFDDASKEFFTWYYPYDDKFKDVEINGEPIKVVTINGRQYFERPEQLTLGYGLINTHIVFTTTEEITRHLIVNMYEDVYQPKLMPDEPMIAGDITFIKTDIVRKKSDGFLPVVMTRLLKLGHQFTYIADGQGSKVNLTNNKGQNIFADTDSVIEISEPRLEECYRYVDELGWTNGDAYTVKLAIALDSVQQAIGRNSGYRWSDRQEDARRRCVVLCEPKLHNSILEAIRYHVETVVDPSKTVVHLGKNQDLLEDLIWFIKNLDHYLRNGIGTNCWAFRQDVEQTLNELDVINRVRFRRRLFGSLTDRIMKTKDETLKDRLEKVVVLVGN